MRTDSIQSADADQQRATSRPVMTMPRLPQDQILAILCESGVPEPEARRWLERETQLTTS